MADSNGKKTGGRKKGVPNEKTRELEEISKKFKYHPFEIMMMFAVRDHKALGLPEYKVVGYSVTGEAIEALSISAELQQKSARDANEYLAPKRKAIEHTGKDGDKLINYEDYLKTLK